MKIGTCRVISKLLQFLQCISDQITYFLSNVHTYCIDFPLRTHFHQLLHADIPNFPTSSNVSIMASCVEFDQEYGSGRIIDFCSS